VERRTFMQLSAGTIGLAGLEQQVRAKPGGSRQHLFELGVEQALESMRKGELSSVELCQYYLDRIKALDESGPELCSVLELNPDALAQAADADRMIKNGAELGPLHGLPVLIKANIATADRMGSSAGSIALHASRPPKNAFLIDQLRRAGAVILGKTNLSEWANFRSTRSSSGWSSLGGQTRNPYSLDRTPCGSSSGSGVAVAADLCMLAIGTETDGSIVCPSGINGIVGIKPTVGLVSRSGIVPISHSQDTAGPMARTVADAVALLGPMTGFDPEDPATQEAKSLRDYSKHLITHALKGAKIGVARQFVDFHPGVSELFQKALEDLSAAGATLVEDIEFKEMDVLNQAEFEVLLYEFKHDLNSYLAKAGVSGEIGSLEALIAYNSKFAEKTMPWFGQEIFEMAQKKGPLTDAAYLKALATCRRITRDDGIDRVVREQQLDAIVAPTNGPAWKIDWVNGDHYLGGSSTMAAVSGYPSITVPCGYVSGLPVGISFFGRAYSEGRLIELGYSYEQKTQHRKPPRFKAFVDLGS